MGSSVSPAVRRCAFAAALLAGCSLPAALKAQPAPMQAAPASFGHAAAKGVTLKALNGLLAMAVFTTGTGSLAAGSVLSTAVVATSYAVFVANDYLWDRFYPNTNVAANGMSFNTVGSLGRNTLKFLTFKPAVVAADWSVIYLYTGSLGSMLTMGPAYSLLAPATFYANNVGWDWYDWWSTSGQAGPASAAKPASGSGDS